MKRTVLVFACLAAFAAGPARAEVGVGAEVTPGDFGRREPPKPRPKDPYVQAIADYFGLNPLEIQKLWKRGYGRNELIRDILVSRKAGKELKEIIQQRDKKIKLRDIAAKYRLDYSPIFMEADEVRKELDYQVARSTPTVDISTAPAANK